MEKNMTDSRKVLISNRAIPLDTAGDALPQRIHIVPRGELVNKEAGVTQVLDEPALQSILADLQNRHAPNGGLYLGPEHFYYDDGKLSDAYAWGKKFGLDEKGIWVEDPEYTDVGAPAIKNKRVKWTSFVVDREDPSTFEDLGGNRLRILKIDTVGFTNYANGKPMLEPITNRKEDTMQMLMNVKKSSRYQHADGTFKEHKAPGEKTASKFGGCVLHMMHEEGHSEESARAICGHIAAMKNRAAPPEDADCEDLSEYASGMTQDAVGDDDAGVHGAAMDAHKKAAAKMREAGRHDEADMHEAMAEHHARMAKHMTDAELKNRFRPANPPADKNQPKGNKMTTVLTALGLSADATEESALAAVTALKNRVGELDAEQVDGLLAERKIQNEKIVNRLKPVLRAMKNREERAAFLDECVAAAGHGAATRVLNRGTGDAGRLKSDAASADEKTSAERITNRAHELQTRGYAKFADAFAAATREFHAGKLIN